MNDMSLGFLPRFFDSESSQDKIIYEEDQEVSEMYFVIKGLIGFAVNAFQHKINGAFFKIGRRQQGRQLICDHYVVNKKKTKFIYLAMEDCECLAITRNYMHQVVFPKNQEIESEIKSSSYAFYKRVIERPLDDFR